MPHRRRSPGAAFRRRILGDPCNPRDPQVPPTGRRARGQGLIQLSRSDDRSAPWCIVQCDGDRAHLGALTRVGSYQTPIQYCSVGDSLSLAQRAVERARRICEPSRLYVTLAETHRRWWSGAFWAVPRQRRIVDALSGRQTITLAAAAAAIEREAPDALAVVAPADAFCANEWAFRCGIKSAIEALDHLPGHLIALGVNAASADENHDYLVLGAPDGMPGRAAVRCVKQPPSPIARHLAAAGACVNSGVYVARIATLTAVLSNLWPTLMETVRRLVDSTTGEIEVPARFTGAEFQRPWRHTWLQRPVPRLRALPIGSGGWSSLGSLSAVARLAKTCPASPMPSRADTPDLLARYRDSFAAPFGTALPDAWRDAYALRD